MKVVAADGSFNIFQSKLAVGLVSHCAGMDTAKRSRSALFEQKCVPQAADNDFITPTAMDQIADHTRHGAAGDKQGGFFAQPLGGHFFQPIYRRVFTKHIIAHLRLGHCLPHGLSWLGHRVGSQINNSHASSPSKKFSYGIENNFFA